MELGLLRVSAPASAHATVIIRDCYDVDTCTTRAGEKIRLACINTPELKERRVNPAPAKQARNYLNCLVADQKIQLKPITKDRYGRSVGELFKGDTNIQQQMLTSGHAEIYRKYAHQCEWTQSLLLNNSNPRQVLVFY